MGEDRTTCTEKKSNEAFPCRHRHSSVMSSCSEDAESESTSTGYPPTPDEDKEEELEYGPGIVNKLRTRFLSITLKQNRGTSIRRSCSMENLLDQDRPCRGNIFASQKLFGVNCDEKEEPKNIIWGTLKRAKSMDTLLMDMQPDPAPVKELCSVINGDVKKEPKIVRSGLNRAVPTICDEELPKPDTVKTYKRMFEPAESRRGSHSRRPPVLRASAKSGALAASKVNGVSSNASAKVNGTVTKRSPAISAKQSPPVKAQSIPDPVFPTDPKQPIVNGNDLKPMCNGNHTVKATPLKINDHSLCNGKEKELNLINKNLNKKEIHFAHKPDVICNGNATHKEIIKTKTNEEIVNHSNKSVVNNIIGGLNSKPKIPPNRPGFLKNHKPTPKTNESRVIEKKSPVVSKLKNKSEESHMKLPEKVKIVETETKSNSVESRLKEDTSELSKVNKQKEEIMPLNHVTENKSNDNSVEENNRKNVEKTNPEIAELISPDKLPSPEKQLLNGFHEHVDDEFLEDEKISKMETSVIAKNCKLDTLPTKNCKLETVSTKNSELETAVATKNSKVETAVSEVKLDNKLVKKPQASAPSTTSMVFDFRGKDVVPHVAVLPVPFGCKALHPKKRPLLIDGKEAPNGNGVTTDDEDEDYVDYSVPPPSGVVFEGENVKIGKGSILCIRNKDLKITFDDDVDNNTFIYPSETSLMEDSDTSLSPVNGDYNEIIPNGQPPPSKLKTNTSIGSSSAGGLSTYTPSVLRTMDNFQPGMFRPPPAPVLPEKEEEKNPEEEENTQVREEQEEEMLKPADPDIISSWSLSAGTSDLLF